MEAPELYHQAPTGFSAPDSKPTTDHFIVEDLLDFSNYNTTPTLDVVMGNSGNFSNEDSSTLTTTTFDSCNSSDPFNSLDHLSFPYDDMAELEWLSNFVEESFSSEDMEKLRLISGAKTRPDPSNKATVSIHGHVNNTIFDPELPVPAKARSKRSRAAPINWASRLLVFSSLQPGPTVKKNQNPNPRRRGDEADRKCLHCATDKTPQWRTGPMGPKTLCNACGVRYKSGRLVPEYRPAASPTFVLTKHSNSHRKVMELRRQKELMRAQLLHPQGGVYDVAPQSNGGDDFFIHQPDFGQLT